MKQVLIDGRGDISVVEVPAPTGRPGRVLVRTTYSLISTGTELATVRHQSSSLVGRAMARPEAVKGLVKQAFREGVSSAKESVEERITRQSPLGYSAVGTVLEVGEGVPGLGVGDRVVCSGAEQAFHAEILSVPFRLAVPVPEGVRPSHAAFAPVAAIAMQAVRRSGASLGETVVVIGLGLVGLLSCQLLKSAGCTVIGVDPIESRRLIAAALGVATAAGDSEEAIAAVHALTGGAGADAVVVAAATKDDEPINLAAALARERGRVVVVGDVGMRIDREPFYRKELDLVMSRSLGPGRYDRAYEQDGLDYPAAYVRWTEARNVDACLRLMATGSLDISALSAAEFDIERAPDAYAALGEGTHPALVLAYPADDDPPRSGGRLRMTSATSVSAGTIGVGLIGPGAFARAVTLPALKRSKTLSLKGIAAQHGHTAKHAAEHFGAAYATADPAEVIGDPDIQAVWITTVHDSHADLAVAALEAGKHVFLEKPIALTLEGAIKVTEAAARSSRQLMVGFNRRFAPASAAIAELFKGTHGPKQIVYRVVGDDLPDGHWLDDAERGGGRLLGEAVHFLDWMAWLLDEEPMEVFASSQDGGVTAFAITVSFDRGSTGLLSYSVGGPQAFGKERIEVFGAGVAGVVNDFNSVGLSRGRGLKKLNRAGKGYAEQLNAFVSVLRNGEPASPGAQDGFRATAAALAARRAIITGTPQPVARP